MEKHRIKRFVGRGHPGINDKSAWEEWEKQFGLPDRGDDLTTDFPWDRWVEQQRRLRRLFEELLKGGPHAERDRQRPTAGRRFGIRINAVSEALAAQLDIKSGEGVLVVDVRAGGRAQRVGIRRHDVILKLNAERITDPDDFGTRLFDRGDKEFELEIIRRGQHQKITVAPGREALIERGIACANTHRGALTT